VRDAQREWVTINIPRPGNLAQVSKDSLLAKQRTNFHSVQSIIGAKTPTSHVAVYIPIARIGHHPRSFSRLTVADLGELTPLPYPVWRHK